MHIASCQILRAQDCVIIMNHQLTVQWKSFRVKVHLVYSWRTCSLQKKIGQKADITSTLTCLWQFILYWTLNVSTESIWNLCWGILCSEQNFAWVTGIWSFIHKGRICLKMHFSFFGFFVCLCVCVTVGTASLAQTFWWNLHVQLMPGKGWENTDITGMSIKVRKLPLHVIRYGPDSSLTCASVFSVKSVQIYMVKVAPFKSVELQSYKIGVRGEYWPCVSRS